MAGEYQLSYTGPQVNTKLGKIDGLEVAVNQIPSTYETKTDAAAKLAEAKKHADDLVYTLPTASTTTLGGVKVGDGLNITNGVLFTNTVNNLNSTSTTNPLSANQGKILNESLTELRGSLSTLGYGDMLKSIYDTDDSGTVDNADRLEGHSASYFLPKNDPVAVGTLSLNRSTDENASIGEYSVALGAETVSSGTASFTEGFYTKALATATHAEGYESEASGAHSHAEGYQTKAQGNGSHSEGDNTIANGEYAHAEGVQTAAFGFGSHAEGLSSNVIPEGITAGSSTDEISQAWNSTNFLFTRGDGAHAEGMNTLALNTGSHAEGTNTNASGFYSHAEGYFTKAHATSSHAEGHYTQASSSWQHVQGKYNIADTKSEYAHIVGNGDSTQSSNAHTLDWEGNAWFQGDVYIGSTSGTNKDEGSKKLITFDEIPTNISAFTNDSNYITETGLAAKGFLTSESDPTVPAWAKAATKPSYNVDEITNALSSTLLNAANGIATLDENKNLITNEGINITNTDSFYFIDSQERTISYIDSAGLHAINIYTTDREYTKDNSGNPVETVYNLNYELAKLQKLYPLVISDTEPEDAFFWIDTSV